MIALTVLACVTMIIIGKEVSIVFEGTSSPMVYVCSLEASTWVMDRFENTYT